MATMIPDRRLVCRAKECEQAKESHWGTMDEFLYLPAAVRATHRVVIAGQWPRLYRLKGSLFLSLTLAGHNRDQREDGDMRGWRPLGTRTEADPHRRHHPRCCS